MQIERSDSPDNEERDQPKQQQPIHDQPSMPVNNLVLRLKRREATF